MKVAEQDFVYMITCICIIWSFVYYNLYIILILLTHNQTGMTDEES